MNRIAIVISVIVLLIVGSLRQIRIETTADLSILPHIHVWFNVGTAVLLVMAYVFIRKRRIEGHRRSIYAALFLTSLFLISYVAYHATTAETSFGGEGWVRYVYFFFLITHVVLAAVILPFILFTFNRAFSGSYSRHRKMARWVYPIWLYVAITGPICYFMLLPYYP